MLFRTGNDGCGFYNDIISFRVTHRNNFCIEKSAPLRQLRLEYSSTPLVAVVTSKLTDICWVDSSPL
jgi:hypothetical protein